MKRREFLIEASRAAIIGPVLTATAVSTAVAPSLASGEAVDAPLPKGGTSRFAQINGIGLHYVSAGSGPVVILLHGWPQTWFAWQRQRSGSLLVSLSLLQISEASGCPRKRRLATTSAPLPLTFALSSPMSREVGLTLSDTIWAAKQLTCWPTCIQSASRNSSWWIASSPARKTWTHCGEALGIMGFTWLRISPRC